MEGGLPVFEIGEVSVSTGEGNVPGKSTSGIVRDIYLRGDSLTEEYEG